MTIQLTNNVLLVSYDLINPGQNYVALTERLRSYRSWAKLGGSAYLIITNQTPVQVRDYLLEVLDNNDKLYVGVVNAPAAWTGMPEEVSNWIRNNLL